MPRKLFSELSPLTYEVSLAKQRAVRHLSNALNRSKLAARRSGESLPTVVYRHKSLIRRLLGNTNPQLQENKAVNLALAAPKVDGIVIRPGETFSFWSLVGALSARQGYRDGVIIVHGRADSGRGGGMCQFTNLIHWMILHSPLTVTEHHHHNEWDLFPDYNRQVPFGVGTSIMHNFIDYRFRNETDQDFQIRVHVTDEHLVGELRAERQVDFKYHIREQDAYFYRDGSAVRRHNTIVRSVVDKRTGRYLEEELLRENDALVCYDESLIGTEILDFRPERAGAGTAS